MSTKMPALFVSHGSPMLIQDSENGQQYSDWGNTLPRPRALLVFSAHWEENGLVFGETIRHDNLVYDFYGFPEPLYQVQYPAPGAEWLTEQVQAHLDEGVQASERGLDHGVWVPLLHMWPQADVPVLQISLPSSYSNQALFELGRQLAPLRQQGVMIVGAGTLTHNLREGLSRRFSTTPKWISQFDDWVEQTLLNDRHQLFDWENLAPDAERNHPTPEHFRPLLIAAGAAADDEVLTFPILGFDMQVFSKRSVQFG